MPFGRSHLLPQTPKQCKRGMGVGVIFQTSQGRTLRQGQLRPLWFHSPQESDLQS